MPEPRAYTANMMSVRALADRALDSPDGLEIAFRVGQHGSLDACKHLALSFQQSFSSLRARARRLSMNLKEETIARDLTVTGPYDKLVCHRSPLPNNSGWIITLTSTALTLSQFDVTDIATGKPLTDVGLGEDDFSKLIAKYTNAILGKGGWTAEDRARIDELKPGHIAALEADGFIVRGVPGATVASSPPAKHLDLADLPEDVDPFTGRKVEEGA